MIFRRLKQRKFVEISQSDERAITDYRILVSRSDRRPNADLYAFNLKDSIPAFPVPLRDGESEPSVDLQKLLNEVYARARFDLAIDYSQPVKPALSPETAAWVAEVLRIFESQLLNDLERN